MMMTEVGYVERPILEWLAGNAKKPHDRGLGWRYRPDEEMEQFSRPLNDPLVEALLVPAIMRINPAVKTEPQAQTAVAVLRTIMASPDPLDANRRTLDALRDGVPLVLEPGQSATTVRFIEFALSKQDFNDFTVTNQYRVRGTDTCKADTVLLVNGIPLVVAEFKSIISSGHDWVEGVNQIHRYQQEAAPLLIPNVFSVAADEFEFRYGPVAFRIDSQQDIDLQRDHWRPWLSQYPARRMYWNLSPDQMDADPVRAAVQGLLRPCNVLDFLANFAVFETKNGRTVKKIARYQQFEAANDIMDRTLELYGKDAKAQDRTGLIWHTQGSGKSLTMIYAGQKLRRDPRLQNPTVLIVVDRRDLKTQLGDDFDACDYPSIVKALGVDDLKEKIATDKRETIITTIQCFQGMDNLEPCPRDNVIALVDEAHRSQKAKKGGYAITMRAKLPKAFRYGFTGTPIDRTMVNTHRDFGPIKDGKQERYLSYYGIRRAILDGATREVYYQFHKIPMEVDEEPLSIGYEQMCEEMEVEDDEEKELIQRKETRWKALARDPRRVAKVVAHLVDHFLAHPDPSGFKAQLVAIDRPACAIYKDALDIEFQKRGLPPEWSEVVISQAQNDPPELKRFHYTKEQTDDLIDYFKLTPAQWGEWNLKKRGEDQAAWRMPLKILIDRLLTGFDAPIEQVMYLDKPLRDHNLLQAIARTNRPLPEMGKRNGLIVDYFGVFEDLQKALNFDESIREEALIDWGKLRALMPEEIRRCMAFFNGLKIEDTRDCLFEALRRIADFQRAEQFESQFKRTQVLWEALAPDECLYSHRREYAWLCGIYVAHRRRNRRRPSVREDLAVKTRQLIQEHTTFMEIAEDVPVYRIDENYLLKVQELPTVYDRAAELEAALTRELAEDIGGFLYKRLGERLQEAIARKEAGDEAALRLLEELTAMVEEINVSKGEPERLGLTAPGEYALFSVIREYAHLKEEALCVRAARSMLAQLQKKKCLPEGWSANAGGRKGVSLTLQVTSWDPEFEAMQLCPVEVAEPPFLEAAVEELARALE
jgi:type I restriction enzyme R subunit